MRKTCRAANRTRLQSIAIAREKMKFKVSRECGNALVVAMVTIATLAVCVAVVIDLSVGIGRQAQRSRAWSDGTATGLGAVDLAFASWRQICRASYSTDLPASSFTSIPVPTKANFPAVTTFTLSNYRIQAVDPQLNAVGGAPPASVGQSASTKSLFYLASADVSIPVIPGSVDVHVRRVLEKQTLSPWNWAIFFDDSLEIHPGPAFAVTGWVHTNGNLYTGSNALTFNSKATYSGGWKIGFMPGDGIHTVATSPYWPKDLPPAQDESHQPFGLDPSASFDSSSANQNIQHAWRELIERPVGDRSLASNKDPLWPDYPSGAGSRYFDQAGIKVLIRSDGSRDIYVGTGAGTLTTNGTLHDTIDGAFSFTTIQDNREGGAQVRLANLDVSALYNGGNYNVSNSAGLKNFNGILYVADTSATSSTRRGIRLRKGYKLANGGLTIASENPIYIQGDYNTGTTTSPSATPASNAATIDPTKMTVTGYNRQPAAIIGDAVYVLSNAWPSTSELTYSSSALASRVASNTTVNAAILGGIVRTGSVGGTNYSGGAENFPRFMETWTGKNFTYYGSMVQLYSSGQATGAWGATNVYDPPNRYWYFDTNFPVSPPPGSLVLTTYKKGRWYLE
jgi:hypothetical protein